MLQALIAVDSIGGNAGGTSSKAIENNKDQAGFTCAATTVLGMIEPSITAESLRANQAQRDPAAQVAPDYEHPSEASRGYILPGKHQSRKMPHFWQHSPPN
ncbi:hypothetical protein G7Y79_00016g040430 [Physcia stellaris]|nr:hypothetical protein G7Y79_00016g040430 [Physcia stellaris]